MLLIGLTGSIATGKSTVSSILASEPFKLPIVDADILARKVVEPGTRGYNAIVKHFGPTTPDLLVEPSEDMPENGPDGKGRPLNRPALGRRVFGDSEERKKDRAVLNGIVHPAVRWEMFKMVVGCYFRGHWAVVLDIPLLFESGLDRFCGVTAVVAVRDPAIQMQRLRARDPHLSTEDAENRVRSQTDVREKARRCEERGEGKGVVLWNDGTKEELREQLDKAIGAMRKTSPDWWSWFLLGCPPVAVAIAAWRFWQNIIINEEWEEKKLKHKLVEVTTDDESEEDTIKITYPRTGRSTPPPQEAKTIVKRVRFEDTPKSALKKSPTPLEASDEASDSGSEPESDSSQSDNASSSDASDSDAENSDNAPSPKKKKKKKAKQKPVADDAESDWDSDPDPTCECRRCTKGREILRRIGKKHSKDSTSPSTQPPDSEPEEPPKPKKKECGKEKKGGKKAKEPESETDTSESAEETSESESESPPKKQQPKKEQPKKQGKKNTKVEESTSGGETSESEAESPKPKKKKKGSPKSDAKEDETPEESETDAEPSDSTDETEAESEPEPEPKKKQKQKNKGKTKADSPKNEDEKKEARQDQKGNKQKNKGNQKAGKQAKKAPDQPEDKAEDEEAVETSNQENQGKYKKAKENRTKEGDKENAAPQGMVPKNSWHQNGFLWGGYPQGLLFPHPRRRQLIEPIRAQVVQTPSDSVPNAYYDPENNVMRQYQGPPTGNNHGYLYPAHNAFSGTPPPVPQTPFYYGFNQPQPQPGYSQYPQYHQYYHPMPPQEGYAHVPITQGMPGHVWPAVSGPQGFPPALPMGHGVQVNPQVMGGAENAALPPSKDKDKTSQNNVMPPGLTGQNNPYLPQRAGSVFKNYGSHGARTASKGDGSARAGSNNWNNNVTTWNDGNGNNQQNSQTDWNPVPDHSQNGSGQNDNTWGQDQDQNQDQNGNGNNGWDANSGKQEDNGQKWASGSNGSNRTVRKKRDDHWGNDTHLGGNITWEEQKDTVPSTTGPAADNNVVGWDVVTDRVVEEVSPDSRKSDKGKDEEKPGNVMPGSWVETPGGVPAWGDVNAAVDTQGGIVW
ncbi:hypothetical protein NW757_004940 [Fusarium falciforme]|nr:hypothetical protein NW757_004940 [Fusarium falciforme]